MIQEKHIKTFKDWLSRKGCEILPLTSEFEVIRFRSKQGTGVVYTGRKGHTVNSPFVTEAYNCFVKGEKWVGGKPTKRINGSKLKRSLVDRDGRDCFFCGMPMENYITLEHLLSIIHSGPNRIENCVLAHSECNEEAENMSTFDKVKLRERKLGYRSTCPHVGKS